MRVAALLLVPTFATTLASHAQAPTPQIAVSQPAPFDPANGLTAPIAYMVDAGSGQVMFDRESDRRFMPASLTKIMTAYVAFELLADGKLAPNQRFVMNDAAFAQWHQVGSTMFIGRGQSVSVDELLMGIMTVSANDGCIVLAEGASGSVGAFVSRMNATARKLGMTDSHFGSPNGWPDQGATYTTARDLAVVTQAMVTRFPAAYRRYVGHPEMSFNGIRQGNHVPIIGRVAGADGVKTGFTNEAGYGFVGSAVRNGRRLVMVVGGYDRAWARARESRAFLEWGFSEWDTHALFTRGFSAASARVQGGEARSVPLAPPVNYYLTFRKGQAPPDAKLAVRYRGPLEAPVLRGSEVASLEVTVAGEAPRSLPLFAARDVPAASAFAQLRNGLLTLVGL